MRTNKELLQAIEECENPVTMSSLKSVAVQRLRELVAERDELAAHIERLRSSMDDLIRNSEGVVGLHMNGDIAPWSDLNLGGCFEEWLCVFDETPAQSLAAVRAEAVESAIECTRDSLTEGGKKWFCHVENLATYAQKIRNGEA